MKYKKRKDTSALRAIESAEKVERAFRLNVTIEDFLRNEGGDHGEFTLKVLKAGDKLTVYIQPVGGKEIYRGYVCRFNIMPATAIDNLAKYMREKKFREGVAQW